MTLPTINNSTTATSSSTTLTLTVPTGVASGQLAAIYVSNDNNNDCNTPTDFTLTQQFSGNQAVAASAFHRVVDGTEGWTGGTSTVDVTVSGTLNNMAGFFVLWDDVDNTTPIDVQGTPNDSPFASGTLTLTGVTTSSNDCVGIVVATADGSDGTLSITQSGWTESTQLDAPGSSTNGTSLLYATQSLTGGGTTDDATIVYNPTDGRVGLIFAIRGATAGGGSNGYPVISKYYKTILGN